MVAWALEPVSFSLEDILDTCPLYEQNKEVDMSSSNTRDNWLLVLRWVARIFSLPAIFFAVSELIFPATENGVQENWFTWATVVLMFLSVAGLLIAWWKEVYGGWVALSMLALFFVFYWIDSAELFPGWSLLLAFVVLPAMLFLLFDFLNQKFDVI